MNEMSYMVRQDFCVRKMYDYVAVVSKMLLHFRSPVKRLSFQLLLFRIDMRCSINILTKLWLKM